METRTSTSLWVAGGARRKIVLAVLGGVVMVSRSAIHFSANPERTAAVAQNNIAVESPAAAVAEADSKAQIDPAALAELQGPSFFPSLMGDTKKVVPVTPADEDERGGIILTSSTIGLSLMSVAITSQTSAAPQVILTPIDAGVAKAQVSQSSMVSAVPEPVMASLVGAGALLVLGRRRATR